ncbi:hypothetical protein [Gallibacter intestinalis]|uniref:DNA-binding protein n=1 Tax=Gallibacter intestinalis TaxID=2779356 RepID=A0ABR9QWN6_9FIRM|nr:hypothetical protein [Gallibacter intestinalis]MBE5035298.1 hypothetical protein [Gallibacter intestinalis]
MSNKKDGITPPITQEQYIKSEEISKECRFESYIQHPVRYDEILNALGDSLMTARMIGDKLGYSDLNAVKPRLSELKKQGRVMVVDKVKDNVTGRNVSVFKAVNITEQIDEKIQEEYRNGGSC